MVVWRLLTLLKEEEEDCHSSRLCLSCVCRAVSFLGKEGSFNKLVL